MLQKMNHIKVGKFGHTTYSWANILNWISVYVNYVKLTLEKKVYCGFFLLDHISFCAHKFLAVKAWLYSCKIYALFSFNSALLYCRICIARCLVWCVCSAFYSCSMELQSSILKNVIGVTLFCFIHLRPLYKV